jgi:hypothetical protein
MSISHKNIREFKVIICIIHTLHTQKKECIQWENI